MREKYTDKYFKKHYSQLLNNRYAILDWQKDMLRFFKRLSIPKDESIRIVDIGCGVANLIFFVKKQGYKNVFGVDISKSALKNTKKFYKSLIVSRCDCKRICIKTESINVCFMSQLLEHLNKQESMETLKEIRRILKPNGLFISSHPLSSIFSRFIRKPKTDETHVQHFLLPEFLKIIRNYFEVSDYTFYGLNIQDQLKLLLSDFNFHHVSEFIISVLFKITSFTGVNNPFYFGNITILAKK